MDTDVFVIVHDFKIRGKPIYLKSVPMRKFKHWSAVVVTLVVTVFGTLLYINFSSGEKQIHYEIEHEFAVEDSQLLHSIAPLLGPEIPPGKRVTALHNGRDIFPAMLAAIRGARETITFETYICWSGDIGRQFSDALCNGRRRG